MYTYRPLTAGRIRRRTARAERTLGWSRDIVVHALLVRGGAMTTTVDGDVTRPVEKNVGNPSWSAYDPSPFRRPRWQNRLESTDVYDFRNAPDYVVWYFTVRRNVWVKSKCFNF